MGDIDWQASYNTLMELVERVRKLHVNRRRYYACDECDLPFPCETVRILGGWEI